MIQIEKLGFGSFFSQTIVCQSLHMPNTMRFSQLGLYNYDDYSGGLIIGAESDAQSQMENTVIMTLYLFAEGALFQFADRQFAGMD